VLVCLEGGCTVTQRLLPSGRPPAPNEQENGGGVEGHAGIGWAETKGRARGGSCNRVGESKLAAPHVTHEGDQPVSSPARRSPHNTEGERDGRSLPNMRSEVG
jgi:hypothetical protein